MVFNIDERWVGATVEEKGWRKWKKKFLNLMQFWKLNNECKTLQYCINDDDDMGTVTKFKRFEKLFNSSLIGLRKGEGSWTSFCGIWLCC